ncbi:MAG: c-type cytochrome [Burkholderiales bacterium]|nr:c-type cytochrome [Burkholderiales bacterium]
MQIRRRLGMLISVFGLCAAAPALSQSDQAQSDVTEGQKLYIAQCQMCHGFNVEEAARAPVRPDRLLVAHATGATQTLLDVPGLRVDVPGLRDIATLPEDGVRLAFAPPFGPNLRGIIGREAGTAPGFEYSRSFMDALKGMVWTEGTLDWWIRDTQAWVPGVVMYYRQADPEVRRKIIAFLKANP